MRAYLGKYFFLPFAVAALFYLLLTASETVAAEVVIIAETSLGPVTEVVASLQDALPYDTEVVTPAEARGRLNAIVSASGARAVVALGVEATEIASSLPGNVPLIYGLVVKPLHLSRQNATGVYMATPLSEYTSLLSKYTALRKIGVVCEQEMMELLAPSLSPAAFTAIVANTSYEFISRINSMKSHVDAFLLLPEKRLLTAKAIEELYRISFSEKIPVIGASERHVKMGALMAVVFDNTGMGRQIGDVVKRVSARGTAYGIPAVPADKFNLYLNLETAKAMKINLPHDLIRHARRTFP